MGFGGSEFAKDARIGELENAIRARYANTVTQGEYTALRVPPALRRGDRPCIEVGPSGRTCQWISGHYGPHNHYLAGLIDDVWWTPADYAADRHLISYRNDADNKLLEVLHGESEDD